jgi:hypothetical protein
MSDPLRLNHLHIRETLESSPARRVEPGLDVWDLDTGPWWKLFTDWKGLERAKQAILAAVWDTPDSLFFMPPMPEMAAGLKPFLIAADSGAWLINRQRSSQEFYGVDLNEGNWMLYAAAQRCTVRLPNTFKANPAVLLQFMRDQGITVLVDAFYDDWEWRVALVDPREAHGELEPSI